MAIDFLASEAHFEEHLRPVWEALPAKLRGTFFTERERHKLHTQDRLTVVAAYGDMRHVRSLGRLVVMAEHGAGQSYLGARSGSYIGSPDRAGVVAVLMPGPMQAERHSLVHPTIPAHVVGVPKLDAWHPANKINFSTNPVVAVSFHWPCRIAPEARGTWEHWRGALPALARQYTVLGHAHPRVLAALRPEYRRMGIEVVADFEEVLERAHVYVCDNSSTMYEWASLDRPVVVLNAPWFRRHVEHGLRFWSHAELGPQVWRGPELPGAVGRALDGEGAARRREVVAQVYAPCDGSAAQRAASALAQVHGQWATDRGALARQAAHKPAPAAGAQPT